MYTGQPGETGKRVRRNGRLSNEEETGRSPRTVMSRPNQCVPG